MLREDVPSHHLRSIYPIDMNLGRILKRVCVKSHGHLGSDEGSGEEGENGINLYILPETFIKRYFESTFL